MNKTKKPLRAAGTMTASSDFAWVDKAMRAAGPIVGAVSIGGAVGALASPLATGIGAFAGLFAGAVLSIIEARHVK